MLRHERADGYRAARGADVVAHHHAAVNAAGSVPGTAAV
jgi:hypothetical protein